VANTLKLFRQGAVGFIDWLDGWRQLVEWCAPTVEQGVMLCRDANELLDTMCDRECCDARDDHTLHGPGMLAVTTIRNRQLAKAKSLQRTRERDGIVFSASVEEAINVSLALRVSTTTFDVLNERGVTLDVSSHVFLNSAFVNHGDTI